MKLRVATLAAVCLFVTNVASAEEVKGVRPDPGTPYEPVGGCDVTDYKAYSGDGGSVPDCTPGGSTFGPVMTPADGSSFGGAVLEVGIDHTWMGDLIVNLFYDAECDGSPEVGPISALCRAGLDGCAEDGCCGCSDFIGGTYLFGDDGAASLDEVCVAGGGAPSGCYSTDPDSALPMAALDGVLKGGCFTLNVVDGACADTGFIGTWTVYSDNGGGGTPVEETTWSELKGSF